ncbi:HAD family hydrolase, partial [Mesorhizobium sp. M2D.F.Ca.ET.145.01.1.1]
GDWHRSIAVAISVLIVTCPCALGLAVPIVQVVAARCLFELGIMVKDGSALERLAEADTVLFDKTGVLTLGKPVLANAAEIAPAALGIAAAIAVGSRHPSATAIAAAGVGRPAQPFAFDDVKEIPGLGLEAWAQGAVYRLGRHDWATGHSAQDEQNSASVTVLTKDGEWLATFLIEDDIRPGAEQVVRALKSAGLQVGIVSGDRRQPVQMLARRFDIDQVEAELLPAGKLVRIEELA